MVVAGVVCRWRCWRYVDGCKEDCSNCGIVLEIRQSKQRRLPPPPPPTHFFFIFVFFIYFFYVIFFALSDAMTWAIFLKIFFYVYKYWDSRYRKKKEKDESSHRPATGIFVRNDRRTVCICWFTIYFFLWLAYLKINSWSVRVVYCGCRHVCDRCVWLST